MIFGSHIRDMFKQCYRTKIWAKAFTEKHCESFATKALKELVSCHSSYQCEQGLRPLAQMIIVENKFNKLSSEKLISCLRIALTKTFAPRFDLLQSNIQELLILESLRKSHYNVNLIEMRKR